MSEVLGDADPPGRGRRPLDDDRPAFEGFDDDYGDLADGFAAEPGRLRRFVAKVASPESLAIAAIVVAAASFLEIPAVIDTVNSLTVSRGYDPAFGGRVDAAGQFLVAAIGFVLAISARRRKPVDNPPDAKVASWVPMLSGGALIIGAVSALLAVVAFLVAGTAHNPNNAGLQSVTYVGAPSGVAPAPVLDHVSAVIVDTSSGAVIAVSPTPSN